ncbi:leukotriene A-4 hydrol [Nadsonia fulvescens var. elongata DSM 6958]|uniref:Leukotriene A(4) hydrolase n=1 Tax=Nadsonia fulvescens var. elongata DSM 6958 TaxID=857566 RepID=A0A1E3PRF2_9ASCO|nr:leukotriene A-4 hydrol [Nadsonia fulvescens var. elongata DSM 6958]
MSSTVVNARAAAVVSPEADPSTLSNYREFQLSHTTLNLKVSWSQKILDGKVDFIIRARDASQTSQLILDTSYLKIKSIKIDDRPVANYTLSERDTVFGSKLSIPYPATTKESQVSIEYATTKACTALQWLEPAQTEGKQAPYLFSQCQAIHARSLFPCFDTPSVKSPYKFIVDSEHASVASGNPIEPIEGQSLTETVTVQEIPIPSYLVAIASGDLAKAPIGPRSHVYSEPPSLNACQHEFCADTEGFIQAAEKIVFPYDWKTYNVLVLPPSFPYGGMENPNITFATPTLISGDRQNVAVIAHELAHSWSGNLVTNCSWEHFWLNEGWCVYLERRIIGAVHGELHRHLGAIIGWHDLEESIKSMPPTSRDAYSRLIVDLKDSSDPDDAFSTVPYEKGFNLLFYLENLLGGKPVFDPFIPYYFSKYRTKSLDSYEFKATLYEYFANVEGGENFVAKLDSVDWDTWFYTPGMPPITPNFDSTLADNCFALADRWNAVDSTKTDISEFVSADIEGWTSTQIGIFLDKLSASSMSSATVLAMNDIYHITKSATNAEVISRWYRLAVEARVESQYELLAEFLSTVGRMKFVRPGYRLLKDVDAKLAKNTFEKNRDFYHPICRAMVEKDLA